MKTMRMFAAIALLVSANAVCHAIDKVISEKELPAAAQTLIKQSFAGQGITLAQKDQDGLNVNYDVLLADGTKLEFDSKGEWREINTKPRAVPPTFVPAAIAEKVQQKFPNAKIVQIERGRFGYEVDLSNGLDIHFDKKCRMKKIDD